jgi:hypothetical protein
VDIHEVGDRISQVTSKYGGGNIIITALICLYEFGYLFPLQEFVRDVLRYYILVLLKFIPMNVLFYPHLKNY